MSLQAAFEKYTLNFRFIAGTSRGTMTRKSVWLIKVWDENNPDLFGIGEIGPLAGLSPDAQTNYTEVLGAVAQWLKAHSLPNSEDECLRLADALSEGGQPALRFGLETALLDLWSGGRRILFPSAFTSGNEPIPINGLIWMGDPAFMRNQARSKLDEGFTCMKMKIGAIGFEDELNILELLKEANTEVIRVDANGAFSPDDVQEKLEILSDFGLHSIEQPIAAGQWQEMRKVCQESPVPVALDEELIGVSPDQREQLLDTIQPAYIILKPTLLGGMAATRNWIQKAEERKIGWWMTSALESNIGLNAIAQQTAVLHYSGHQGLGTGQLYENNFDSPMIIRKGEMHYDNQHPWDLSKLSIC